MKVSSDEIKKSAIYEPSENIVAREISGEIILVPLISGIGDSDDELFTLNETGKAIWKKLDGQSTLGDVIQSLLENFNADPEMLEADVVGFVDQMAKLGILKEVE